MVEVRIDPEFQALIYGLSDEELAQLETNILAEGCRDPLVVWQEEHILLDGHNRLRICQAHDLSYQIKEISLPDRYAASVWIINNQLGRRNLTPMQASDLRGKRYSLEKQRVGAPQGNQNAEKQRYENHTFVLDTPSDSQDSTTTIEPTKTRERLAAEFGVTPDTIVQDEKFSKALDVVSEHLSPTMRQSITGAQPRKRKSKETSDSDNRPPKPTKGQVIAAARTLKEQQVTLQPFMKRGIWPDHALLEATKILAGIPKPEHEQINALLDQGGIPYGKALSILKALREMPQRQRQNIYSLYRSEDQRDRSLALTMAAQTPPEPDPQVLSAAQVVRDIEQTIEHINKWYSKWPFEPWSEELLGIIETFKSAMDQIHNIQKRVRTHHEERVGIYGETPESEQGNS